MINIGFFNYLKKSNESFFIYSFIHIIENIFIFQNFIININFSLFFLNFKKYAIYKNRVLLSCNEINNLCFFKSLIVNVNFFDFKFLNKKKNLFNTYDVINFCVYDVDKNLLGNVFNVIFNFNNIILEVYFKEEKKFFLFIKYKYVFSINFYKKFLIIN
ncbi:MAG TPA: hypothetical protein V8P47_00255 [Candidatus Azosocius sp. HAIN]